MMEVVVHTLIFDVTMQVYITSHLVILNVTPNLLSAE